MAFNNITIAIASVNQRCSLDASGDAGLALAGPLATPPSANIASLLLTNQQYLQPDSIILSARPTKSNDSQLAG